MIPLNKFFLPVCLILLTVFVSACNSKKDDATTYKTKINPEAPPETAMLGQLIGTWDIDQSIINKDGTWGERKRHAIWKWYYILDGHAIQDDWILVDSLKNQHAAGTNIRIYNPEEKQWYMAWIDKTVRRLATFTATNDSNTVVMDGHNAKGQHIKNIFYNIKKNEFDWRQEWTFDDGKTWITVTIIHGTRIL